MSVRRPRGDDDDDELQGSGADDQQQRHGPRRIRPAPLSFRSLVRRAATADTIQQIVVSLEPVIRRVVREEIQNIFAQHAHIPIPCRSLPLHIQEVDVSPPLKLSFTKRLMLPIFTNNKLVDATSNAIEIRLVDTRTNCPITQTNTHLGSSSTKLQVFVLDGDFRCDDGVGWTDDQFNAAVVKAREGRRPLLVGCTLNVPMGNHGVAVLDDVSFTDNSSWIRSRKFRIGVRVMASTYYGPRIQEAVSESFTVKDHRGELYKKHYPPNLTDNIWRLKNIGKDGPIDKRLESEGIKNVQDFLKLNTIEPDKLKSLVGMSDRQWRTTLNHAKTCDTKGKCYVIKSQGCEVIFNPIGEILAARIGDQTCSLQQLHQQQMVQVKELAVKAYQQWDQLEEVAHEAALAAYGGLIPSFPQENPSSSCTPASNESMISSGSQNAEYLDNMGSRTATSSALMATNSSSTLDSATATVPASCDAMFWIPSMAADDHFSWNNSPNLGCWDQVD
ncbi:protein SAR DEFICIENT 1 isoform X2 [Brachypodium distachyon]|uniref:Calmodulin-binding protein n=1 Tax=Brachypodium distachyon TaxID=15368 RepID=A0A0Q3FA96_BRADI|nr:protein SAR DEFICIENT 1 isoform X2 [Brachypodium distachyon]KQJ96246.1 hypothetical protein BRADI_3g21806v3 [Brachypodium distachyon]|eukprot:XP_014756138.1 protein SAR DEFICIENT 1 isoform X2 [Brachypodium distachyon]